MFFLGIPGIKPMRRAFATVWSKSMRTINLQTIEMQNSPIH